MYFKKQRLALVFTKLLKTYMLCTKSFSCFLRNISLILILAALTMKVDAIDDTQIIFEIKLDIRSTNRVPVEFELDFMQSCT